MDFSVPNAWHHWLWIPIYQRLPFLPPSIPEGRVKEGDLRLQTVHKKQKKNGTCAMSTGTQHVASRSYRAQFSPVNGVRFTMIWLHWSWYVFVGNFSSISSARWPWPRPHGTMEQCNPAVLHSLGISSSLRLDRGHFFVATDRPTGHRCVPNCVLIEVKTCPKGCGKRRKRRKKKRKLQIQSAGSFIVARERERVYRGLTVEGSSRPVLLPPCLSCFRELRCVPASNDVAMCYQDREINE